MTASLPKISIVIPNYNGARTIEATLRSVLDQGYADLELIVIDGGSKDESVDIIKKYAAHIAYWESQKDRGQSHAINKGFAKCTGDVVNWLCSDDLLAPGALETISQAMTDPAISFCIGKGEMLFPDDARLNTTMWPSDQQVRETAIKNHIPQASCFFRRQLLKRDPVVRENFNYAMDQELWCYFLSQGVSYKIIDKVLSIAIQDGNNKTRTADYRYYVEADWIFRAYWGSGGKSPTPLWYRMSIRPLAICVEKKPNSQQARIASWGIQRIGNLQKRWRRIRARKPSATST